MNPETKQFNGQITECKQEDRNGVPVGLISGYMATFDIDRGAWGLKDQFVKGAFLESIADHQQRNRQIRFKDHHGRTVGGFPPGGVFEDSKGLFGTAEVNLDVQQGRELYSLAKQKVIVDFSIGFSSLEDSESTINGDRIRTITKAKIWESSGVDEPMNPEANITEVKSMTFQDLPIADRDSAWNQADALTRVGTTKAAFLCDDKGDLKLPVADMVGDTLTIIPKAVFAAAAILQGAKDGIDLPEDIKPSVITNIEKYYAKMSLDSPFDKKDYDCEINPRNIEQALKTFGFSRKNSVTLASKLIVEKPEDTSNTVFKSLANEIKLLTKELKAS